MLTLQYDLFKNTYESEIDYLKDKIESTQKTCEKVRKGSYAMRGEFTKEIVDLRIRLEILERNLCS